MTRISKLLLSSAVALFAPALQPGLTGSAHSSSCVDVALVLTVDASASVSRQEFALQQSGIAAAFRDPDVLDAISAAGRVAVSIIFWGSEGLAKPQSGWISIENPSAAESFARTVETMPRNVTGDTGLGAGLLAAVQKFESLDQCAIRKVVNVSGDGEETRVYRRQRNSPAPVQVRDLAQSSEVEINALAIANEEKDLAEYYASNVITGPDAFVMQVTRYEDFAQALQRKLIREIGPRVVSRRSSQDGGAAQLN
jgi:hypothetical protein